MAEHESHSSTDGDLPPKARARADQAADTIKSEARSFADKLSHHDVEMIQKFLIARIDEDWTDLKNGKF